MNNIARLAKAFDTLSVAHISSIPNLQLNRWTNLTSQVNFRLMKDFGNKRKISTSHIYKDEYLNNVANSKTQNNEEAIETNNRGFELILNSKDNSCYTYSPKENKTILDYIKVNGSSITSFQTLAVKLGRPNYNAVNQHYRKLVRNNIRDKSLNAKVKGRFTTKEDQVIMDYVSTHGCSPDAIKNLMQRLGGRPYSSVINRYKRLLIKKTTEIKSWTFKEDEKMLQYFLNANNEKSLNKLILEKNLNDFSELGKILGRNPDSCYNNWNRSLLPILKTHMKGLPLDTNWKWKENVKQYIIREKVEYPSDIDYDKLIRDVCPGQTRRSVRQFIQSIIRNSKRKSINDSEVFLYESVADKKEIISSLYPGLGAMHEKKKETYLRRAQNVINCYESLIKQKTKV